MKATVSKYVLKDNWLFIILLSGIHFFSFSKLGLGFYQLIHIGVMGAMILFLIKRPKITITYSYILVLMMMAIPLLSVYSCKILHGQSYFASLIVYRMHLGWLLYFVLWNFKVDKKYLIKSFFALAIGYTTISLIQQITFPIAPFGNRTIGTEFYYNHGSNVIKRFGFLRFSVSGVFFAVMMIFFYYAKEIKLKKTTLFLLLIGILASGTRQFLIAFIVSLYLFFLYNGNVKYKLILFILGCATIVTGALMWGTIFNALATDFEGSFQGSRVFSYMYYWDKITDNPISFFLGNGLGHASSDYGSKRVYFAGVQMILSDIGLVGTFYYYGIFYVTVYYVIVFRFLFNKWLALHLKAILLFFVVISPMYSPLWEFGNILFQSCLIYLCDLDIKTKSNEKFEIDTKCKLVHL